MDSDALIGGHRDGVALQLDAVLESAGEDAPLACYVWFPAAVSME